MTTSEEKTAKRERRMAAKAERERQLRKLERRARARKVAISVGVVVALAVATLLLVKAAEQPGGEAGTGQGPEGTQAFEVTSRDHVDGAVEYPQTPPVGGDHAPVWQNCGVYDEQIAAENGVHSMEHGAVWITYQPDLPEQQVSALAASGDQSYVLVSPYEGLPSPIVASSWGHQLRLSDASDPRLAAFTRAFAQGPGTPELGAPCTGGLDAPA